VFVFYIPPPRPSLVPRPRLTQQLSQGTARKLTLISAPAGFGKMTLIGDFIQHTDRPVAWISLDAGDNDLARFMAYVIAALQNVNPGVGEAVQVLLPSPPLP